MMYSNLYTIIASLQLSIGLWSVLFVTRGKVGATVPALGALAIGHCVSNSFQFLQQASVDITSW